MNIKYTILKIYVRDYKILNALANSNITSKETKNEFINQKIVNLKSKNTINKVISAKKLVTSNLI